MLILVNFRKNRRLFLLRTAWRQPQVAPATDDRSRQVRCFLFEQIRHIDAGRCGELKN